MASEETNESGEHEVVHVESKGTSYAFKCEKCGQPTLWGEGQGWEHHPELLTAKDDQSPSTKRQRIYVIVVSHPFEGFDQPDEVHLSKRKANARAKVILKERRRSDRETRINVLEYEVLP